MSETTHVKTFLNLTPAECQEVYPEIQKNAREFYRAANLLASNGFYSKAISLRILGAEEYIKCLCILLDGYGCNTRKIPKVKNIFSHHISRHKISRDFLPVWSVVKYLISFRIVNSRRKNLTILAKTFLSALTASSKHDWWNEANVLKNDGLYVDYKSTIVSPSRFTSTDYESAKRYTTEMPSILKSLQDHLSGLTKRELEEFRENFKLAEFDKLIEESLAR